MSRFAVDGNHEGHLPWVVNFAEIAVLNQGLVPFLRPAVVAVLHDIGSLVECLNDVLRCGARPSGPLAGAGGDVAQAIGTKIVDDSVGAARGRPLVAQLAAVYLAEAGGQFPVLAEVTVYRRDGELEP